MPSNETSLPSGIIEALQKGVEGNLSAEDFERLREKVREAFPLPEDAPKIPGAQPSEYSRSNVDPASYAVPAEDPYAPTAWGKPAEQDFICPSGQRCRVRRVDIMDLMGEGLLNNLDFMTAIVENEHISKAKTPRSRETAALSSIAGNKKNLNEFKSALNSIVMRVVVAPKLHPVPADEGDRIPGLVYVDSVSMTDRTSIFNWAVTGQDDESLRRFREEAEKSVGNVESGEIVSMQTVDLPRDQ